MSEIDNRRQQDRCGVIVRAVVHGPGEQRFDGRVRNISPTGACVEHHGHLLPGDEIALEMGRPEPQPAKVTWSSDRLAGISFLEPASRRKSDTGNPGERRMVGLVLAAGTLVALTLFAAQAWLIQQAVRGFW
jgi:PilZ domain-containing protein